MNKKLKKVYSERALMYKCPIETFEKEGVTIVREEKLSGKGYITVAHTDVRSFIRIDPKMQFPDEIKHIVNLPPDEVINLLESYYLEENKNLKPLYRYYYKLDDAQVYCDTGLDIRQIVSDEDGLLKDFFSKFPEDELDDADIDLEEKDPIVFGGFMDGKLVAYSSHRYPTDDVADIGVLVDADYRGRGFGKHIVAHDVNWCIEHGIVSKYVVLEDNKKSIRLVESLGFERVLTVYKLIIPACP